MSLIGSLEDLGLGDILQIIHLSQKSGVLSIRGAAGEGRLVFQGGLVRLASLKGDPEDLRALVVERGFVTPEDFETAEASARETGCELPVALANTTSVSLERIESLRRECIERAVAAMFSWTAGDFSFDVGAEEELIRSDMSLSTGVNAQYLAMESLRVWDEGGRAAANGEAGADASEKPTDQDLNLEMSAAEMFGVAEPGTESESAAEAEPVLELETELELESELEPALELEAELEPEVSDKALDALVEATAAKVDSAVEPDVAADTAKSRPAPPESAPCEPDLPPVVVIAPELHVLEWIRRALTDSFANVHLFQRSQEGLGRIRQYLSRAQAPILLVSPRIEGNPLSGIVDAADFVTRLRGQAPRMPILWLVAQDEADDAMLPVSLPKGVHPARATLPSENPEADDANLAQGLIAALIEATRARNPSGSARARTPESTVPPTTANVPAAHADLERLERETRALSEASNRGEILPVVMRFASEMFARIAVFMVRGDVICGMAQSGIESSGGPTDVEMRALRFDRSESSWFREVIETGRSVRAPVRDAGDARLCELIGGNPEREIYVAPILSSENVVAILYGDNGSRSRELPESSGLEVVLQHAGLALDRAALERALAEVEEES